MAAFVFVVCPVNVRDSRFRQWPKRVKRALCPYVEKNGRTKQVKADG